jgi:hypothetical protein
MWPMAFFMGRAHGGCLLDWEDDLCNAPHFVFLQLNYNMVYLVIYFLSIYWTHLG